MTKKQFLQKVRHLNRGNSRAIISRAEKILRTGGLDLGAAEDNFLLPKAFMAAACRVMARQWEPLNKESQKDAKNIERLL